MREHAEALPEGPMRESDLLFPSETGGFRAGSCLDKPVLSQNWNETKVSDAGDLRDGEGGLYRWDLDA